MEHRQSSRIPLALDVDIAFGALPLGRYLTRNISRDGMFLETGPSDLKPGDVVSLDVHLSHGPRTVNAVVVHRSEAGIGVMLTAEAPEYSRFVLAALRRSGPMLGPAWARPAVAAARGERASALALRAGQQGRLRWAKDSKALVLSVGERLDISANALVQQAIESIETKAPEVVVVDLAATRKVFDSGMALLLLLRNSAGQLRDWIYLANCQPRIFGRLARAGIASQFRIA